MTLKQREILTHKYVHGLKNKEIADLFRDSPSKLHQRSLQKLKNYLQKEQDSHDDS
ncbi:hypothetical protein ABRT01_17485 [Lentibacillus sp. L22]|uniref:hypothetical protein n=1 Tax=Lentibacillus sp. L22 TaxID=3163028 RepID=UPI003467C109